MEFTPVNGYQILKEFYPGIKEPEIERTFGNFFNIVCKHVTYNKEQLGIGTTDGIIRFYDEHHKLLFWILQETKRDVGVDSVWFGRSLLQAIMYLANVYYDTNPLGLDNFKGIFLDSKRYFCYITKEELDPVMELFEPLWEKYYRVRPSDAFRVPDLEDFIPIALHKIRFKHYQFNEKFNLDQLIKDLYENNI